MGVTRSEYEVRSTKYAIRNTNQEKRNRDSGMDEDIGWLDGLKCNNASTPFLTVIPFPFPAARQPTRDY